MYSSTTSSGARRPFGAGYPQQQQPQRQQNPYQQHNPHRRHNNHKNKTGSKRAPKNSKRDLLVLLGSLLGLAAWYLTPISDAIVEIMLLQVPIEADKELARSFQFDHPVVYHPKWTPMLKSVGWELVASAKDPTVQKYDWDFAILQDPNTVNAFALPGGIVRVTSALLEQLQLSEGQLAALIGHEMGHVVHRHSQARILSQKVLSTALKALVYQDDDPHPESFGEAIGELMLQSADWLGRQSFSRTNEYQADAFSWDLLSESQRYNPESVRALLNKLWDYHGRQGGKTSWESTHPGTLDRIGALEEKWAALDYRQRRLLQNRLA